MVLISACEDRIKVFFEETGAVSITKYFSISDFQMQNLTIPQKRIWIIITSKYNPSLNELFKDIWIGISFIFHENNKVDCNVTRKIRFFSLKEGSISRDEIYHDSGLILPPLKEESHYFFSFQQGSNVPMWDDFPSKLIIRTNVWNHFQAEK